jgi:DNA polymerase I-like protein with 3'-5' exonuclease and polymerase domains
MNLQVYRKPSKKVKQFSTAKMVLEKLCDQHEMPRLILEWRQINNAILKNVYPLERAKFFNKNLNMWRIHCNSDMCTVSGRLIIFDPCLQMIPRDFDISARLTQVKRFEYDNNGDLNDNEFDMIEPNDIESFESIIDVDESPPVFSNGDESNKYLVSLRRAFIPGKNNIFLSADYCQLELRIMAHLCKDTGLQQIMNNTKNDVFLLLTSKWLSVGVDQITDKQRQQTKQVLFF